MVRAQSPVIRFRRKVQWKPEYWWYSPFVAQGLALMVFSTIQYNRFALTHDFALYWQAVWLIAHGHLNPYSTVGGFPFLDNHFELIMWPLAFFYWIWPHASLLLYLQDSALMGTGVIAWIWLTSWVNHQPLAWQRWLRVTGVVLLMGNPWIYWTAVFDFHSESLIALTIMGAAYALWRQDFRKLAGWTIFTLLSGDVAALLVMGLGLTALMRRRGRTGLILLGSGLVWLLAIGAMGADKGSVLESSYGYLAPHVVHLTITALVLHLLTHPIAALRVLWHHKTNLYANLAPSGLLGLFSSWGIGVIVTTLIPSSLTSSILFSEPGFQNVPVMGLVVIGSLFSLMWVGHRVRWRYTVPILSVVLMLNTLGWAIFWVPRVPTTWVRVKPIQSHTLNTMQQMIPASAEVMAPQAVIGRFAGRPTVYPMMGGTVFPLAPHVPHYVVMAPYQGIHLGSIALMAAQLKDLAQMVRARLIDEHHGVYLWQITGSAPLQLPQRGAHVRSGKRDSLVGRAIVFVDIGHGNKHFPCALFGLCPINIPTCRTS